MLSSNVSISRVSSILNSGLWALDANASTKSRKMAPQTATDRRPQHDMTLLSLNVEGFVRNDCYVKHILLNESQDFLCLQETWLMDGNQHVLDKVNEDYISFAKSGVDNVNRIYTGRAHGGVAILFRKRLCNTVN